MKNVGDNIIKSLQKRQEAFKKFKAKRGAFLLVKEQITREIEEAGIIWNKTLEQLPHLPFE